MYGVRDGGMAVHVPGLRRLHGEIKRRVAAAYDSQRVFVVFACLLSVSRIAYRCKLSHRFTYSLRRVPSIIVFRWNYNRRPADRCRRAKYLVFIRTLNVRMPRHCVPSSGKRILKFTT